MGISNRVAQFYFKKSVFKDKEVLKKGHHPLTLDDVLHRDEIINKYLTYLQEAIRGKVPDNLLVYGTFGTGKTMLTRLITNEISLAAKQLGHDVVVVYVYCESMRATSPLMQYINQSIIDSIHSTNKLVGISKARNFSYFKELVNEADVPVILIFDEIDKLQEPDLINEMSRIKECGFTKNNVCIIGITNDSKFYDSLDGRTKSILGQNELLVTPYKADELNDILDSRAKCAFVEGALGDIVIPYCSAIGAQENGDARIAIDLLRVAGDIADQRGSEIVEEIDARSAKESVEINRPLEVVRSLPTQTKCVLFSCAYNYKKKKGEAVESIEIYPRYVKVCDTVNIEPVKTRRVNDYIGELHTLGILSVHKVSRGKNRGVCNSIKPLVDTSLIVKAILQDSRFENLANELKDAKLDLFELNDDI